MAKRTEAFEQLSALLQWTSLLHQQSHHFSNTATNNAHDADYIELLQMSIKAFEMFLGYLFSQGCIWRGLGGFDPRKR